MDEKRDADLPLNGHFTILVYPFRHAVEGAERDERLRSLAERWEPWWSRHDRRQVGRLLSDTFFFLPYAREVLFPETKGVPALGTEAWQAAVDHILACATPLTLASLIGADEVLRLTLTEAQMAALRPTRIEFARSDGTGQVVEEFTADFTLDWIDVVLFPQEVGLLLLAVRLPSTGLTVGQLNEFHYYLRPVHAPTVDRMLASWAGGPPGSRWVRTAEQLVNGLLNGLAATGAARVTGPSVSILEGSQHVGYSGTPIGEVYGQAFRLYMYACLAERQPLGEGEATGTIVAQTLYELSTVTDMGHPDYRPDVTYYHRLLEEQRIALWANWQGLTLHDNVTLLGLQPGPFTEDALRRNASGDYFHLFLLTEYQRMRLNLFRGDLIRRTSGLHRNLRDARRLWDDFTFFRNRYWLGEVTRGFQGEELYRHFQRRANLPALFAEVSREVEALREHYERKATRRSADALNVLTYVLVPAGFLSGIFSGALAKNATWTQLAIAAFVLYGLLLVILFVTRRRHEG